MEKVSGETSSHKAVTAVVMQLLYSEHRDPQLFIYKEMC